MARRRLRFLHARCLVRKSICGLRKSICGLRKALMRGVRGCVCFGAGANGRGGAFLYWAVIRLECRQGLLGRWVGVAV